MIGSNFTILSTFLFHIFVFTKSVMKGLPWWSSGYHTRLWIRGSAGSNPAGVDGFFQSVKMRVWLPSEEK